MKERERKVGYIYKGSCIYYKFAILCFQNKRDAQMRLASPFNEARVWANKLDAEINAASKKENARSRFRRDKKAWVIRSELIFFEGHNIKCEMGRVSALNVEFRFGETRVRQGERKSKISG